MASPTVIPSIAALREFIGKPLGHSDWTTVTQEQIQRFADATGDQQWIHVDVERAKAQSPFKAPIAHGYLTISLAPVLLPQVVRVEGVRMGVNWTRQDAPARTGARRLACATRRRDQGRTQMPGAARA